MVPSVRHIDLNYDTANSQGSALALILALLPEWRESKDTIEFVKFTDGITNTLLKAINKRPGLSKEDIDDEAILLRAYGSGTHLIIDRDRECTSHSLLASHHLAPPLLARFNNGLLYRFIPGRVCQPEDLRTPSMWRGVASRLAEWHATMPIAAVIAHHGSSTPRDGELAAEKYPKISDLKSPNIWDVMDRWVSNVPETSADKRKRKEQLKVELRWLIEQVGDVPGVDGRERLVFGHCDLLCANVIVAEKNSRQGRAREREDMSNSVVLNIPTSVDRNGSHSPRSSSAGSPSLASAEASAAASNISLADDELNHHNDTEDQENINTDDDTSLELENDQEVVDFIDYEYSTPCPAAFDIANHFAEWAGFNCDFSVVPTKSQRRDFLRAYLKTCDTFERPSEDGMKVRGLEERLDELMSHVDHFRGAPGFYWGVWAMIQAEISQIDFDYASYAELRLSEYFAWKDAVINGGKSNEEAPLRERRWAEQ